MGKMKCSICNVEKFWRGQRRVDGPYICKKCRARRMIAYSRPSMGIITRCLMCRHEFTTTDGQDYCSACKMMDHGGR